jgi:O-antigen/teichoic acid export membrane protein
MKHLFKKIAVHGLARDSVIVFVGSMISNVGAYLYHLIIGRILGPQGYGELSSLISLLYIFGVPTIVLQTVLVKYFSNCKAKGSFSQARYLFHKMMVVLLAILIPMIGLFAFCSPFIAEFLHLPGGRVVIWVYLSFFITTLTALSISVIQGFQLFIWYSVLTASGTILRVLISIPFAYNGVEMTMIASFLTVTVFYMLYFLPLRFLFRSQEESFPVSKRDFLKYSIPTFLTLLGMTSLYSMDIVLVKHYFSPYEAGIYSSVAVLGKVIFYASAAIGTVLFPVISERFAKGKDTFSIIRLSVFLVTFASVGVTALYTVFPRVVVHFLFGTSYDGAASFLGLFAIFITFYSMVNIIVFSCLALEKMHIYLFTCCASLLQIILITIFHESLFHIIYINMGVTFALLMGVGAYYWYGKNQHYHPNI